MVKKLLLLSLLVSNLLAQSLQSQIVSMMGQANYQRNRGLVNILFKDKSAYETNGRVDLQKVSKILEENSLLDLKLRKREDIKLSFATKEQNTLLFIKLVKEVLSSVGYSSVLTTKAMRDASGFLWQVQLKSSTMIPPSLIAKAFKERSAYITKIKRISQTNYRYNIDIYNAKIKSIQPQPNEQMRLKKPLNPYWIDIYGAKSIKIASLGANRWHPYIVFYDSNLKILDNYAKERRSYNITLKVPRNARYIKISDLYTLQNIKRGLKITVSK